MNSTQRKARNWFIYFFEKQTHTQGKGKRGFNTKAQHKLYSKAMVTFKEVWGKLYYTQHILLSNVEQLPFFFFFEKQIYTHKREGKGQRGS